MDDVTLSLLSGLIGALIGAILSPYLSHRNSLRFMREESIFKAKLDAYEIIISIIEKRIDFYNIILKDVWMNKEYIKKEAVDRIHNDSQIENKEISKKLSLFQDYRLTKIYLDMLSHETLFLINLKEKQEKNIIQKKLLAFENLFYRLKILIKKEIGIENI